MVGKFRRHLKYLTSMPEPDAIDIEGGQLYQARAELRHLNDSSLRRRRFRRRVAAGAALGAALSIFHLSDDIADMYFYYQNKPDVYTVPPHVTITTSPLEDTIVSELLFGIGVLGAGMVAGSPVFSLPGRLIDSHRRRRLKRKIATYSGEGSDVERGESSYAQS